MMKKSIFNNFDNHSTHHNTDSADCKTNDKKTLRRGAAVSVVTSGSEIPEFEPHSGSDKVTLFPSSVYHHYGDSYDGGSYQSIGLSAKLPQAD